MRKTDLRLSVLVCQRGPSLQMFLLYSYLKSTLTTLRKLILQELKIKIFKLHFLLLWEFCKKDILPVAATFCMRLKKWFTRFRNLEFLPKLNIPKFANWQLTNNFSRNQSSPKFAKFLRKISFLNVLHLLGFLFSFIFMYCI